MYSTAGLPRDVGVQGLHDFEVVIPGGDRDVHLLPHVGSGDQGWLLTLAAPSASRCHQLCELTAHEARSRPLGPLCSQTDSTLGWRLISAAVTSAQTTVHLVKFRAAAAMFWAIARNTTTGGIGTFRVQFRGVHLKSHCATAVDFAKGGLPHPLLPVIKKNQCWLS